MKHIDKYKTQDYFQKYISNQTIRIDKFKKMIVGCGESEKLKIYQILSNRYKDLISAQFSSNEEEAKIKKCFEEYAECVYAAGFSCYSEYIDFLSLQIILGINDISIDPPQDYNDDLSKILNAYINGSKVELTGYLYEPRYYSVFADYCKGNLTFIELMDYVARKWYVSSMDFYWFDSHLKNYDVYTGYWCYIASAVIRIKGDFNKISEGDRYIL